MVVSVFSINFSFASSNPDLTKEIERKLYVDLSFLNWNEEIKDDVIVEFKVVEGQIMIQKIQGKNESLNQQIERKLEGLCLTFDYDERELYTYKFTFEVKWIKNSGIVSVF